MELAFLSGFDHLRDVDWPAQNSPAIAPGASMFETIASNDVLLFHPYESFEPVLRLIEEAAEDPDVIAIKQVLYRTARKSRIIDALIKAAENGKHVTALVELKARFDEARNLDRADELQRAGAQIVYGVKDLKTHAKICLIVRRESGHLRRYVHLGTGNYNETTSKLYTDLSYLTCKPGVWKRRVAVLQRRHRTLEAAALPTPRPRPHRDEAHACSTSSPARPSVRNKAYPPASSPR